MKKVRFDTNTIIDVLLARNEFARSSSDALRLAERKLIKGYVSAASMTDIYYIVQKTLKDSDATMKGLNAILGILKVAIESFHNEILQKNKNLRVLEISTRSNERLGQELSAFNLKSETVNKKIPFTVETAFQSSKVFENGGLFIDLLYKTSKQAKTDERLKTSGKIKSLSNRT